MADTIPTQGTKRSGPAWSRDAVEQIDVCLVSMPYPVIDQPSMALGLLKSALKNQGIAVRTFYPCIEFAEEIGLDAFSLIADSKQEFLVGEWTFAGAAFPDFHPDHEAFLDLVLSAAVSTGLQERSGFRADPRAALWKARNAASAFTDRVARALVAHRPRIVGCTSTFFQHCASLALLRRVKALDPGIVTVIGGANCEGAMGVATKKSFDWVDFVVSGEADTLLPDLCRALLADGPAKVQMPTDEGLISARNCQALRTDDDAPRASVFHMDQVPEPTYDDYFETLGGSELNAFISPGLPIETSRGCWWGAKKHCTFCGLNGGNMAFRSKSADRVFEELRSLSGTHGIRRFNVVDNILDMKYLRDLLPRLAKEDPYSLFFETKANLRRDQVETIAAAGIRRLQPGIESMHDDVLRLIDKGTTGLQNTQLLKWAREFGIFITWNFLWGVPGEKDEWYGEMADWLPKIVHLQPPGVDRIQFHRFSPYHKDADRFALELIPFPAYRYVYPLSDECLTDLAYYFDDSLRPTAKDALAARVNLKRVMRIIARWNQLWGFAGAGPVKEKPLLLIVVNEPDRLAIKDTRPCATAHIHHLNGLTAKIYRLCDSINTVGNLASALATDADHVREDEIVAILDHLERENLLLKRADRYLSLAMRQVERIPDKPEEFPGGYTDIKAWYEASTAAGPEEAPLYPCAGTPERTLSHA